MVLCGDINIAREERDVHPKERKPNAIGQRPDERAAFTRLLGHGLVDVGRALDPDNDALFTWWAPWRNLRQRNIGWRLDYVLASEAAGAVGVVVRESPRVRHQRSRSGGDDLRRRVVDGPTHDGDRRERPRSEGTAALRVAL